MRERVFFRAVALLLVAGAPAAAQWSRQASGVSVALYDIACSGRNQAWAVGAGGTILHTSDSGEHWSPQTSGTNRDLYGVDFVDSLHGWAAGSGPTILCTTDGGASWQPQPAGITDDLLDIAFGSETRGWACGVNGAILGTTDGGASWNREVSGIWGWYRGIAAGSASGAWTIGGDWFNHVSPIYHYNGSSWVHQYDITRSQNGQDIAATGGNILWAVADSGTIAHSTNGGANWAGQNSGTTAALNGVGAVSADRCWIVGAGGLILATTDGGATWQPESSGTARDLQGIAMLDAGFGRACGDGGEILVRAGVQAVAERQPAPVFAGAGTLVRRQLRLAVSGVTRAEVRLFDAAGRPTMTPRSVCGGEEVVLSLDRLAAGVHFVAVTADGRGSAFRFVKAE